MFLEQMFKYNSEVFGWSPFLNCSTWVVNFVLLIHSEWDLVKYLYCCYSRLDSFSSLKSLSRQKIFSLWHRLTLIPVDQEGFDHVCGGTWHRLNLSIMVRFNISFLFDFLGFFLCLTGCDLVIVHHRQYGNTALAML